MASTKAGEIGPAGQSFMEQAKAMASGHSDSSSGTSGGSGSSSSSGPSGGSGNSSSGGNSPPGNPPPSGGASNDGGNVERKILLFALLAVAFASFMGAVTIIYLGVKSTTPEGIARANRLAELENEKDMRRHAEAMEKFALRKGQPGHTKTLAPGSRLSASSVPAPVPSNCRSVETNEGVTRLTAVQPGFGQCITLPGSSTRQLFFLMLNSPPKEITGRASFAHMREEMEADKIERRARCMAKTGDAEYCEAEMRKRVGVRVGEPCLTMDSPDRCVSYLKGKTHVPIVVHSNMSVSIIMN